MLLKQEQNDWKGQHRYVSRICETISRVDHLISFLLVISQRVDNRHVWNLDTSPPDIEDNRPSYIPDVPTRVIRPDRRSKDAQKRWDHDYRANDIESVSLAPTHVVLVWQQAYNRCRNAICQLPTQQCKPRYRVGQLQHIQIVITLVDEPHWGAQVIWKVTDSVCIHSRSIHTIA